MRVAPLGHGATKILIDPYTRHAVTREFAGMRYALFVIFDD